MAFVQIHDSLAWKPLYCLYEDLIVIHIGLGILIKHLMACYLAASPKKAQSQHGQR